MRSRHRRDLKVRACFKQRTFDCLAYLQKYNHYNKGLSCRVRYCVNLSCIPSQINLSSVLPKRSISSYTSLSEFVGYQGYYPQAVIAAPYLTLLSRILVAYSEDTYNSVMSAEFRRSKVSLTALLSFTRGPRILTSEGLHAVPSFLADDHGLLLLLVLSHLLFPIISVLQISDNNKFVPPC